jgi:DNA-binding GntR family transcriptional regulator
MSISDQINELRAELAGCVLTKAERVAIEAELAALVEKQEGLEAAASDDSFDSASEAPAES